MSTEFARAAGPAFPGCMYNLQIDCGREIDFDFFDEGPSLVSTSDKPRVEAADDGEDEDVVVAKRDTVLPDCSDGDDSSTTSPAREPPPPEPDDEGQSGGQDLLQNRDSGVADGADEPVNGRDCSRDPDELLVLADHDVEPQPPPPQSPTDTRAVPDLANHAMSTPSTQDQLPEDSDLPTERGDVSSSEDPDADGQDDSDSDGEAFGVQELMVTVKTGARRGCKSSVSSITAVTTSSRDSGDSDVEDAIEAITKALRTSRPPSSVACSYSSTRSAGRSRRINMSFSNEEARRIQRENELLLRRIVTQRGRAPRLGPPGGHGGAQQPTWPPVPGHRCSHTVNRTRRGKDIERENQILLKKIQAVKRSPSQLSMSRSSSSMSGHYSYG